ncbi:14 kDa phosphohistidine phosphatase isoform X2 [Lemur catta]|uniref:14 kDa phosphohistidine phosphatase isoform X2 n=1 Tax=Lemur catta TaxID=9447 RepID=UPI001E269040|nr:14 kDa phosphohistidine phosphatase isoform X2 [Lemur catta]
MGFAGHLTALLPRCLPPGPTGEELFRRLDLIIAHSRVHLPFKRGRCVQGCKEPGCDWPIRAPGGGTIGWSSGPRAACPRGIGRGSPEPPFALSQQPRSGEGRGRRDRGAWRAPRNMAAASLAQIPDVDIDSDGVFKYVLIRVQSAPPSGTPAAESKEIVRGGHLRQSVGRDAEAGL